MARLLVIVVFYLAALAAGRHIHSLAERGRSMFWSKEELHAQCQDVRLSDTLRRNKGEQHLKASCRSKNQAPASEPLVTSTLDLNECLGWDKQKQNFISRAGGMGIREGDCWGCRYHHYRQIIDPNMRNLDCWCQNVGTGQMMESPNALRRAALVSFDMDGVIGVANGVLKCHDRLGKIVN